MEDQFENWRCIIRNCSYAGEPSERGQSEVGYYIGLPKNPHVRAQWARVITISPEIDKSKKLYLCYKHSQETKRLLAVCEKTDRIKEELSRTRRRAVEEAEAEKYDDEVDGQNKTDKKTKSIETLKRVGELEKKISKLESQSKLSKLQAKPMYHKDN